jgi:hypothetical protein
VSLYPTTIQQTGGKKLSTKLQKVVALSRYLWYLILHYFDCSYLLLLGVVFVAKQVQVHISIPAWLFDELQATAQRDLSSISTVGRKAIALGLASMDRPPEKGGSHADR